MAQQWNYNYWQTNPYGVYYDYTRPAQTLSSSTSDQSSTPPPPGVEAKPIASAADTTSSSSAASWSNGEILYSQPPGAIYPYHSGSYAQLPRPPVLYSYEPTRPIQPMGYQGYSIPQFPFQPQDNTPNAWNSPSLNYGYPAASVWPAPNTPVGSNTGPGTILNPVAQVISNVTQATTPDTHVIPTPESKESLQKPPESLQAKGTKEQWTDELKDYVQRAFSSIDTSEEKDQMERILKEKLEYIFRNNIQIDWTTENIPTIPSRAIAGLRNSFGSRPNSVNVLRPVQLPGLRGIRSTGPVRGSLTRLPVGVLPRGGRNVFSNSVVGHKLPKKKSPRSRSRSRSPTAHPPYTYSRRSRSPARSNSSKSSISSRSSSGGNAQAKRRRRRSIRSRSNSIHSLPKHGLKENEPRCADHSEDKDQQVPSRGGRKNRRRKRGGAATSDAITDKDVSSTQVENQSSKSRGRGGWRGKRGGPVANAPKTSESRLSQRANRFKDHLSESVVSCGSIARTTSQLIMTYSDDRDDLIADFEGCQIVGTMQEIEKPYLRLTRAPDPSEVRPTSVLKLSLEHIKNKMFNADYHWVCEQFKSIRQDLTVQGIEDDFTVSVYEAHADAALDAGDFEEFHQCQSQLLRLHKEGLGVTRLLEFTAYRLLYYIFTLDILGINTIMAGLRPNHRSNPCIEFALKVRSAWSLNNYYRFFRLVCPPAEGQQPPLRCKNVVNWFLERERKEAIKIIFKVFRPCISLSFVADILGFKTVDECKEFICKEFSISSDALTPTEKIDGKALWGLICQGC